MDDRKIISVGIFFDGTGNNGINTLSPDKPLNNNESYYGALTNIYKLYSLFNGHEKLYVEGIGTVIGREDNNFAMATCANPPYGKGYSSDDKLQKANDFVQKIISAQDQEYHFFIYGFGRGGMLARTFCNRLLSCYSAENIKIKFLGIFDTVESKPFNTYDLRLSHEVEHAFHICALNECRFFFPLTGFFENSKAMKGQKSKDHTCIWKEIFVPGAHADIGGGYLAGPQSVYISTGFVNMEDLQHYISEIKNVRDTEGNKIWASLLSGCKIEKVSSFFQAYVSRDHVPDKISEVYGKIMMDETNTLSEVFNADKSCFKIDADKHPLLNDLYADLKGYIQDLSPDKRPVYDYGRLSEYIHISSNFGLYSDRLQEKADHEIDAEEINNRLNVSSNTSADQNIRTRLSVELHLPEDSFAADFLYGTNVPNNDMWTRTIIQVPARINTCNHQ